MVYQRKLERLLSGINEPVIDSSSQDEFSDGDGKYFDNIYDMPNNNGGTQKSLFWTCE